MSDLREDFSGLLADNVRGCGDRHMVRELPSLHAAWDGSVPLAAPWRNWFLTTFLGHREASRVLRAMAEVRACFVERNKRRYEATGVPELLPDDLIEELQRRVLTALHPSAYEVAVGATKHPADQVARGLRELGASEEKWRKSYC